MEKKKNSDRTIKQLLYSVIEKYLYLPLARGLLHCLGLRLRQIIDLLATDKLRYSAQSFHWLLIVVPTVVNLLENPAISKEKLDTRHIYWSLYKTANNLQSRYGINYFLSVSWLSSLYALWMVCFLATAVMRVIKPWIVIALSSFGLYIYTLCTWGFKGGGFTHFTLKGQSHSPVL